VPATALPGNESQVRRPAPSRDPFASAWIPADARADAVDLWEDFARGVYEHDDIVSSVRGRALLIALRTAARRPGPLHLISVAAGLTSYAFLADLPDGRARPPACRGREASTHPRASRRGAPPAA
jgi:hypothetical protein